MNYRLLGEKIRKQRKEKGYTLEQLAERLDVSTTFIGQIERAKGIPSLETLVKIANELEVSVDYLLFDDLGGEANNSRFLNQIKALTCDFTAKEKQIILSCIESFKQFKEL